MARAGPSAATPAHLAAPGRLAAPVPVAAGLAGLALAAGALAIAEGPGRATTYAGSSAAGTALTVCAGLGLIAAGLVIRLARRPDRTVDLALGAGLCWFAPVWVAWQDGPPLIPSIAMVAAGFTFPLIVHLVLTHPTGRAGSRPACLLAAVVYGEALPRRPRWRCSATLTSTRAAWRTAPSTDSSSGRCRRWPAPWRSPTAGSPPLPRPPCVPDREDCET